MTNKKNTAAAPAAAVWNARDMLTLKYRDKVTFEVYGEQFTRSAHAASEDNNYVPWVSCNGETVNLQVGSKVTHVNGMPLDEWRAVNGIEAPAPVETPAPVAVETAPVWVDEMTALYGMIAEFRATGNHAAADALIESAARIALNERIDDKRAAAAMHAATHAPKAQRNPNKQGRVTAPAAPVPPSAPKASKLVTMPTFEACNTTDPTLKNYVDPRMFAFADEIEADALELAKAAHCNIRVYYRNTWAWFQPVNCAQGFGRSDAFKTAAKVLPHGYQYTRAQLADMPLKQRQQVMATEMYQYAQKRGQVRRVMPLF